jgi:hypothetical protein
LHPYVSLARFYFNLATPLGVFAPLHVASEVLLATIVTAFVDECLSHVPSEVLLATIVTAFVDECWVRVSHFSRGT